MVWNPFTGEDDPEFEDGTVEDYDDEEVQED
jgi:hypothetical protein